VQIIPLVGANFTGNNYVFSINSLDQITWQETFPGPSVNSVKFMHIDNNVHGVDDVRGFFAAGSVAFEDIRGRGLFNHVTTSGSVNYNDSVRIVRAHSINTTSGGTHPLYDIGTLGDNLFIDDMHEAGNSGEILLEVVGCTGGVIQNCIGGSIILDRCDAVTINAFHTESGNVRIKRSTATVKNSYLAGTDGEIGIRISDGSVESNNHVTLDNITFTYYLDEFGGGFSEVDVETFSKCTVSIRDCRKRIFKNGTIEISEHSGIRVANNSGTLNDDFNNYSQILSIDGFIGRNHTARRTRDTLDCGTGIISLLQSNTGPDSRVVWNENTGPYHYQAQYLYDVARLVGVNNNAAPASEFLTFQGDGMILVVNTAARPMMTTVRIYRGQSASMYDFYADIPVFSLNNLFDSGDRISGFAWIARSVGGVDSIIDMEQVGGNQDHFIGVDSTIPSTGGNFAVGDRVINSVPAVGQPKGWVCTVSGTPGTWESEGDL